MYLCNRGKWKIPAGISEPMMDIITVIIGVDIDSDNKFVEH